jgi:hypothetical protein
MVPTRGNLELETLFSGEELVIRPFKSFLISSDIKVAHNIEP